MKAYESTRMNEFIPPLFTSMKTISTGLFGIQQYRIMSPSHLRILAFASKSQDTLRREALLAQTILISEICLSANLPHKCAVANRKEHGHQVTQFQCIADVWGLEQWPSLIPHQF